MKGRNNNMPFIKSSFTEDDYLKSNNNKNNITASNDSHITNDISIARCFKLPKITLTIRKI